MGFSVGMGRNERIDEIPDHARVAEESGFSHMTFVDQQSLSRDQFVMMAVAAMNTHRIKIGQGVTQPLTYHPSVLANATATIDELSGGRAFLGIGAGGNALRSMDMKARPMAELREAVEFIRKYMSGEEAEYRGARMHSEWVRRQLPIYMAGNGAKSLHLAGELGDGVMFIGVHSEIVKWCLEQVEKGTAKAGRDPSSLDIWVRAVVSVAESKEAARREAASITATSARMIYSYLLRDTPESAALGARLEQVEPGIINEFKAVYDGWNEYENELTDASHSKMVTQRLIDLFCLTGTPEDICEEVSRLHSLGVKTISVLTLTVIDKKGMMREIGDRIMPHFRN